jgi:hypothetical protein
MVKMEEPTKPKPASYFGKTNPKCAGRPARLAQERPQLPTLPCLRSMHSRANQGGDDQRYARDLRCRQRLPESPCKSDQEIATRAGVSVSERLQTLVFACGAELRRSLALALPPPLLSFVSA